MFIYSNHYLIISKLTQEDFKDYFTYEQRKFDYTIIDSTLIDLGEEFIDLSIYEFESPEFVCIKDDNMKDDSDIGEIVVHDDAEDITWLHGELDENLIDYYKDDKIILDQNHRSVIAEPFSTIHWRRSLTLFFELITTKIYEYKDNGQKKTPEEIEKEKQLLLKYSLDRVASETLTEINLNYKDEELEQLLSFPKDKKEVFYLNETTYANLYGYDNFEDQGDLLNHIVHPELTLDLDSVEKEYWNEPLFIFPLIREMHFLREKDDFFDDRYTSPINQEWFSTNEFDNSPDRFS